MQVLIANRQDGERSAIVAATSPAPQSELSEHPAPLTLPTAWLWVREARTWEKTQSSNLGAWGVVQVERQQPLLVLTQSAPQKQPRPLMAAQPLQPLQPTYHNHHSQPSKCSGPAHSAPQPCTRSGTTITGEKI